MKLIIIIICAFLTLGCAGTARTQSGGPLVDVIFQLRDPASSPFPTYEVALPGAVTSESEFEAGTSAFLHNNPQFEVTFGKSRAFRYKDMYYLADDHENGLNFIFAFKGQKFIRFYSPR